MWPGRLVGIEEELWGRAGQGQAEAGLLLALHSLLLHGKALPPTFRRCSHVLDTLTPRKPMGSPGLAALLLPLLQLLIGLSAAAGIGCPYLPSWSTLCLLASHVDDSFTGLQWGWLHLLVQKSKKSYKFRFCRRHTVPASAQRKLLSSRCLSEKGHHISVPSPDTSHKGLRSKRTQPADPEKGDVLSKRGSQRLGGPEFSFDLLPEARVIQVTVPPGPEVSVRLCHQWALECEELSRPFDAQKIVSGGCTVDLPYEFLLPCLCIELAVVETRPQPTEAE
ncbi:Interleukin-17 receptor E, partial [Eschrichtius robustus]|nr:Interleukin-17 receptor E [Eschrichtius robustus]